jgi:hypothetical protein
MEQMRFILPYRHLEEMKVANLIGISDPVIKICCLRTASYPYKLGPTLTFCGDGTGQPNNYSL